MVFVDTGGWIAVTEASDSFHQVAKTYYTDRLESDSASFLKGELNSRAPRLRSRDYSSWSMKPPGKPDGDAITKWNPSGPPHLRLSFFMTDRMRAGVSFGPETYRGLPF